MILYINTTGEEKVALALGKAGKLVAKKEFKAKYQQSEKLLPAIDLILQKAKIKPKDLSGIVVVKGPGPFTATRVGVTVANALGYTSNIKTTGIQKSEFRNQAELVMKGYEKLLRMKKKRGSMIVEPVYDREPNITINNYKLRIKK